MLTFKFQITITHPRTINSMKEQIPGSRSQRSWLSRSILTSSAHSFQSNSPLHAHVHEEQEQARTNEQAPNEQAPQARTKEQAPNERTSTYVHTQVQTHTYASQAPSLDVTIYGSSSLPLHTHLNFSDGNQGATSLHPHVYEDQEQACTNEQALTKEQAHKKEHSTQRKNKHAQQKNKHPTKNKHARSHTISHSH